MGKRKMWIVTEMFYPEETATAYIMTEYARSLQNKYNITVICAGTGGNSFSDNVAIERVFSPKWDKGNLIARTCKFVVISILLTCKIIAKCKRGDLVLTVTNPAPMLFFTSLVKVLKGFDLTIVVHDVFPENTIAAGILSSDKSWIFKLLKSIFDWSYSKADRLLVLGRDMQDVIERKIAKYADTTKVEIVENWAEDSIVSKNKIHNGDIMILYAGNMGRVQGLMNFIKCFEQAHNPHVKFVLYGGGAIKQEIKHYIEEHQLNNVSLFGSYKRAEQTAILSDCDIALVSLAPDMYGLGVPSKSYNIMASGKPILYIGHPDSEIACTIKEHDIGYCFGNGEQNRLVEFLGSLDSSFRNEFSHKGRRAKEICLDRYSYNAIMKKINHIL